MEPDTAFQLFDRFEGPLHLRLILQPCIAAIFGYLDGTKDARAGAPPYFWNVTQVPQPERQALIKHGWASVGKVFILACLFDCIFQYVSYKSVAILPAIAIAAILAILPYQFFRGLINRVKRQGMRQKPSDAQKSGRPPIKTAKRWFTFVGTTLGATTAFVAMSANAQSPYQCEAHAMAMTQSSGAIIGGAAKGVVRGGLFGAIKDGGSSAELGAIVGSAGGVLRRTRSYDEIYSDCMSGRIRY